MPIFAVRDQRTPIVTTLALMTAAVSALLTYQLPAGMLGYAAAVVVAAFGWQVSPAVTVLTTIRWTALTIAASVVVTLSALMVVFPALRPRAAM